MKGAHSAKKASKPKKDDKAKKKKTSSSGIALKVDPEIIKSTLAAKPVQDEADKKSRKSSKSAHSAKRKSRKDMRGQEGKTGRSAFIVCTIIAAVALVALIAALATHTIDLSMNASESAPSPEQTKEQAESSEERSLSADAEQDSTSASSQLDDAIEDEEYHNSRFGFTVEVPEGFHVASLVDDGNGIILANDALDMTVRVTGANNVDGQSAQDMLSSIWSQDGDSIGRAEGNRLIVYQYDETSEYFYWIYVGSGSINQMVIEYPVQDNNSEELSVAQQIMQGFAPGRISQQH